jgi:Ca2+-binding EF-hand superfamily protein
MFKRLDRNGDGVITRDEMAKKPGKDHFEEADTDHDGQLSKEEIQAAREHAPQDRGERQDGGEKKP